MRARNLLVLIGTPVGCERTQPHRCAAEGVRERARPSRHVPPGKPARPKLEAERRDALSQDVFRNALINIHTSRRRIVTEFVVEGGLPEGGPAEGIEGGEGGSASTLSRRWELVASATLLRHH